VTALMSLSRSDTNNSARGGIFEVLVATFAVSYSADVKFLDRKIKGDSRTLPQFHGTFRKYFARHTNCSGIK